jgi:hypothetical protein
MMVLGELIQLDINMQRATRQFIVVGAGGIGARVLPTLVKIVPAGSTIFVVDHDIVESTNLLRQPFCTEDIGRPKAQVMQERYDSDQVRVLGIQQRFEGDEALSLPSGPSVILGCVDNSTTRYAMLNAAAGRPHLYLDAGNDLDHGQVLVAHVPGLYVSGSLNAYGFTKYPRIFVPFDPPEQTGCDRVDTQSALTNQIAATYLLQYLHNLLAGNLVSLGTSFSSLGGTEVFPWHSPAKRPVMVAQEMSGYVDRLGYGGGGSPLYLMMSELQRMATKRAGGMSEDDAWSQSQFVPPPVVEAKIV